MHYHWGQMSTTKKKGTWPQLLLNLVNLKDLFGVGTKSKKYIYSRATTNQFHCFNQNLDFVNRMDQSVTKYWYLNEKMAMIPVCSNGRCCSSGCEGIASY